MKDSANDDKYYLMEKASKFTVIYRSLIWAAALIVSGFIMSDLITEGVFEKRYLLFIGVIILSTYNLFRLYSSIPKK